MTLEKEDIEHIAKLARLDLTPQEVEKYASELSVVFDYFRMLDEVDVDGVEETTQVTGLMNVVRDDVIYEISEDETAVLRESFSSNSGTALEVKAVFPDQEENL